MELVILSMVTFQSSAQLKLMYRHTAISLFDLLLCFSDEITYIWSSPRKLSTILIYTVVRYFPMAKVIFVLLVTGRCPGVQVAQVSYILT